MSLARLIPEDRRVESKWTSLMAKVLLQSSPNNPKRLWRWLASEGSRNGGYWFPISPKQYCQIDMLNTDHYVYSEHEPRIAGNRVGKF